MKKPNIALLILVSCIIVMIGVGFVVVNAMLDSLPPDEFTVVDKKAVYCPSAPIDRSTEYRLFYALDEESYVVVSKELFDKYQIGDWFNDSAKIIFIN